MGNQGIPFDEDLWPGLDVYSKRDTSVDENTDRYSNLHNRDGHNNDNSKLRILNIRRPPRSAPCEEPGPIIYKISDYEIIYSKTGRSVQRKRAS